MELRSNNSVFGNYKLLFGGKRKDRFIYEKDKISNNLIKDFLGRESKTYKEIKKNVQYIDYLNDKGAYTTVKNDYIISELIKLKEPARNIYKGALERGYTQKEAQNLVKEFIDKEKKNILIDANSMLI